MKKFAYVASVSAAVLTLAACGSSDSASEQTSAENVEMPAEEAMSGMDATPVADPMAAPGAAASAAASDGASGAASPSPAASAAVEQATKDAEKKM